MNKNVLMALAMAVLLGYGLMMKERNKADFLDDNFDPRLTTETFRIDDYKSADALQYALEPVLPMFSTRATVEEILVKGGGTTPGPYIPGSGGDYIVEYAYPGAGITSAKVISVLYDSKGMTKSPPQVRDAR